MQKSSKNTIPLNDQFYFEQEKFWKESQVKLSNKELLAIFPEGKKTINSKIKEWQEQYDNKKNEIKNLYKKSGKDLWFTKIFAEIFLYPRLLEIQRHIYRLKSQREVSKNKHGPINNFNEQVEIARRFPIELLARNKLELRSAGKNFVCLCPFHSEKTPSFYIFPESNSYHCFGGCSNSHGDQIDLLMKLEGLTFLEAVKRLQNS